MAKKIEYSEPSDFFPKKIRDEVYGKKSTTTKKSTKKSTTKKK